MKKFAAYDAPGAIVHMDRRMAKANWEEWQPMLPIPTETSPAFLRLHLPRALLSLPHQIAEELPCTFGALRSLTGFATQN